MQGCVLKQQSYDFKGIVHPNAEYLSTHNYVNEKVGKVSEFTKCFWNFRGELSGTQIQTNTIQIIIIIHKKLHLAVVSMSVNS